MRTNVAAPGDLDGADPWPSVVQVGLDVVPQSGGSTTAILDFHRALGGDIVSITSPGLVEEGDGPVEHLPMSSGLAGRLYGWIPREAQRDLRRRIRASDLVVIHQVFRFHAQLAAAEADRAGVPYWVVPHGSLDPWVFTYRARQKLLWMRLLGRRILRGADRVVFATAREMEKAGDHVLGARCAVVHWPVDAPDAAREAGRGSELRGRLGIPPEARVLLFLGRLHPMKRVLETIEAVGRSGQDNLHLLVAGPDSPELSRAECARFAERRRIDRVHLLGPVFGPAKEGVFASADGFVSLSERENFGYTVAESAVRGLPVILSPGNDLGAALAENGCGWMLRTNDIEEAVAALRAFAAAPSNALGEMGLRARRWAAEELSRDVFTRRVRELASQALPERAAFHHQDFSR